MTEFISSTLNDMRGGRQSWRVVITLSVPSFALSFTAALLQFGSR